MPNESLIVEIERILAEIVDLGAAAERTKMVPNLLVTNASPAGLTGFITIADDRDGDNILAKKVPGIIYSNNDLVNVLFVQGGEAIAFQQGSQSTNSGLWQIIDGTSTDIFYNSGDVAIGKNTAPNARLELFDTAQAQLRLSFEDGVKFADFTLDTNHDLTIKPSSTGQIILQPTADSIDFFQVLDADGGTPILNVDSTNERVGIGNAAPTTTLDVTGTVTITDDMLHAGDTDTKISFTDDDIEFTAGNLSMLKLTETTQDLITLGPGSGDVDIDFNGDMFLRGSDGELGIGTTSPQGLLDVAGTGEIVFFGDGTGAAQIFFDGSVTSRDMIWRSAGVNRWILRVNGDAESGSDAGSNFQIISRTDAGGVKENVLRIMRETGYLTVGNGIATDAKLYVDQAGSADAVAAIHMRQVDVDEPFIKYQGTANAGTLIRSIVDEGDVTTATRNGWVKIEIDDDGNQVTDGDYFMPFYTLT